MLMQKRIIIGFFISLLGCFAPLLLAHAATLEKLRVATDDTRTRVVLDMSGKTTYTSSNLQRPDRFVVELNNTKNLANLNKINFENTPFKSIRITPQGKNIHVIFDMKTASKPKMFTLDAKTKNGQRIVLDFPTIESLATTTPAPRINVEEKPTPTPLPVKAAITPVPKKSLTPEPAVSTPKPVLSSQPTKNLRNIIVVIDAGHGGKDPGASGPQGTREKEVVLAISKALQHDINKVPGYKAVLTRSSDHYIPLRRRIGLARDYNADVFISIHADAFKNSRARGASVFALSERGASSEAARWLAEKENYSELGGVDLDNKSNVLRSVLLDLSQTATVAASVRVGDFVLNEIGEFAVLHDDTVEQAGFVVLKSPDIPSILIETGFISNYQEERNLRSKDYQRKMAAAISRGVRNYFWQRAPEGTFIYAQRNQKNNHYVVAQGDTLSGIAARFKVSVTALRKANQLTYNALQVGDTLIIPRSTA